MFGTTDAPSALPHACAALGRPMLPVRVKVRRTYVFASFALGSSRHPPHERGCLLRLGSLEAQNAWAWGPLLPRTNKAPSELVWVLL